MEKPIKQDYSSNNAYNKAMKEYNKQVNRKTVIQLTWTPNQMVERIMELEAKQQSQVNNVILDLLDHVELESLHPDTIVYLNDNGYLPERSENYSPYGSEWVKEMFKLTKEQLEMGFGVSGYGITKRNQINLIQQKLLSQRKDNK